MFRWIFGVLPGLIATFIALIVVTLLVVRFLWAWTVPDLFPGAVDDGLVAASISWYTALKVAIFVAVVGGFSGLRKK